MTEPTPPRPSKKQLLSKGLISSLGECREPKADEDWLRVPSVMFGVLGIDHGIVPDSDSHPVFGKRRWIVELYAPIWGMEPK